MAPTRCWATCSAAEPAAGQAVGVRALVFESFGGPLEVREVPDPRPAPAGVVVRVEASGICRSDWHAWSGHDPDVVLPHVPGHELAGTVAAAGPEVRRWAVGDRVTVPFVCACGRCAPCREGNGQVCLNQTQPGFTHWGSLAESVALDAADVNLVALPEGLPATTAASLGCRFATAFRALTGVGRVRPGEWVAVHGCGGVGLSAVQVAVAAGARVVAVDVAPGALDHARRMGAEHVVDGAAPDVPAAVAALTGGAPTSRWTRSARWARAPTRSAACARADGTCRSGCCRRRRAGRRSRWSWSSPASWPCSAATAWRPATTRRCSRSSPPAGSARPAGHPRARPRRRRCRAGRGRPRAGDRRRPPVRDMTFW
ncbi:zinc-binding dehydrogenase [Modestobacter roseus]|uniref:alcohol dehydrogenase n=1 Tax=Modestobacter roseus TaxID=1181884 RepID=A0A562IV62_9ACTN|nr:zinc-binding dehydrogenase [Modestobacter roseus]